MFSAKHLRTGKKGEDLAVGFLIKNGYKIITKNYRNNWGEIDIIAKDKKGTLTFVEVKTLTSYNKEMRQNEAPENTLKPEDNLTSAKLQKLKRVCLYFANRNPDLINNEKGWRIDLIAITTFPPTLPLLTNNEESFVIKHYKNIQL